MEGREFTCCENEKDEGDCVEEVSHGLEMVVAALRGFEVQMVE